MGSSYLRLSNGNDEQSGFAVVNTTVIVIVNPRAAAHIIARSVLA